MAIQSFGFHLLRRHLLPIDGLFLLNETCKDDEATEAFLKQLFSQKLLQETLFIASPNLYQRFEAWQKGENISEKNKLVQALFKYYLRACSRCTPYGMFAGCSTGEFSDKTSIIFDKSNPYRKQSRLDTTYLVEIVNNLIAKEFIRNQLKFYPNNTIYRLADKFHYLYYSIEDGKRNYAICSIDFSGYISIILAKAKNGCLISELVSSVIDDEIGKEDAYSFVNQLIDEQILISEIEPTLTGEDFLTLLIKKLSKIQINEEILNSLRKIDQILQKSTSQITDLEEIKSILSNFVGNPHKDFLQTDLFFNTSTNSINKEVIEDLSKKFDRLLVLDQGNYSPQLEDFKKRFYERYEEAEIPIAIALDSEVGIGYADFSSNNAGLSPFIEDILVKADKIENIFWVYWKQFTLDKYVQSLQNQDSEIKLTNKDLELLAQKHKEYRTNSPASFYAFGSLLPDGEFYLKNLSGPSALTMLGRFGNGDDKLKEKLFQCAGYESNQNPDIIFAEIVHLPDARVGNIANRPALRKYEIPYQIPSSQKIENQILIEDLTIAVHGGKKIILWSKKHNKRVIPRLSSAHNFEKGLSIYRFLADLQSSEESLNVFWHWNLLKHQPFLPRVRFENIILSPAIWNLKPDEFDFKKTEVDIPKLNQIREKFKLPRFVLFSEGDNELFIDFENNFCLNLLVDFWKKNSIITLKEALFSPDKCLLHTCEGHFYNEIVIPLKTSDYQPIKLEIKPQNKEIIRNFSIGSQWLYYKIYCGFQTADELLKKPIKNLVEGLYADRVIDAFFFVRFQDPEPHLRLRFRGNPNNFFYTQIINRLKETLADWQENGLVYKIQTDTYKREIERYGEKTMVLCEELFSLDSLSVVDFISQNPDEGQRIGFSLMRINTYLENFGLNSTSKKDFCETMQKSFLTEFGDDQNRKKLNDKFRNLSTTLINYFSMEDTYDSKTISSQIIDLTDPSCLFSLLSSIIHMFINRLFSSNNRTYELIIYHFLTKIYLSKRPPQ